MTDAPLQLFPLMKLRVRRHGTALGLLIALCFVAATTVAQGLVELRQADMKAIGAAAKAISDMFKDSTRYNSAEFKRAADTIRDKSGDALTGHFAAVTNAPGSRATPNISDERERFDRLAHDLRDYADVLGTDATMNPGIMTESMRMKPGEAMGGGPLGTHVVDQAVLSSLPAEHAFHLMLQTCATCHAKFRSAD